MMKSPCESCERRETCEKSYCKDWMYWFRKNWSGIQKEAKRKYGIGRKEEEPTCKENS